MNRKNYSDRDVRCHALEPGEIVLVHKNMFDSKYKIADKWEDEPYMVESQMEGTPVYSVVQMTPGSTSRILHHNMLHPAHSVQTEEETSLLENPHVCENTQTGPPIERALTALAKANALMDLYFSD